MNIKGKKEIDGRSKDLMVGPDKKIKVTEIEYDRLKEC